MALNCRPGQMAWICIPKTPLNEACGLDQIHGHVVRTVRLVGIVRDDGPVWRIEPVQHFKTRRMTHTTDRCPLPPGTNMGCDSLPDAWLRPFKDFPPEELEQLQRELQDGLVAS